MKVNFLLLNHIVQRQQSTLSRRVVVTGLGAVSPLGPNVQQSWANLLASKCGIKKLTDPEYSKLPCRIAGKIDMEQDLIKDVIPKSEQKSMSKSTILGLIAAKEAIEDSQYAPTDEESLNRTGVCVGIGMVDFTDIYESKEALNKGYNRVSPYFVPKILPNITGGQISMKYNFRGPNHSVSTACATGAHAIGDAFRFIRDDYADVMVCGAAESTINPLAIAGFCRLRALSTSFNDDPEAASRPFDEKRDGFVMSEGSTILVLEELDHALKRNAKIYGEILGYGLSGDASHLTAPRKDGLGAILAMKSALKSAGLEPKDVGYINAHSTSTPVGDVIEARAIQTLFGDKDVLVSSTKGSHGHLLGSAGSLESLFTVLSCKNGIIPPTLNLEQVDKEVKLKIVSKTPQEWDNNSGSRRVALKNSFGFGGTNASLVFSEFVN